jgi:hypothetical protein
MLTFEYLLFVLLVHGKDLILPGACTACGALQGLVEPGVPAPETRHVLALRDVKVAKTDVNTMEYLLGIVTNATTDTLIVGVVI